MVGLYIYSDKNQIPKDILSNEKGEGEQMSIGEII